MFCSNHLFALADFPQAYALSCFLASLLSFLGQLFNSHSLAIHERIHPSHLETALQLNNLAACLADLGELDRAASLGEQSRLLHEQVFGPTNVHLVPVLINLADM